MRILLVLACSFMMFGCTQHPKLGATSELQATFSATNAGIITAKLSELCKRHGFRIDEQSKNTVTCSSTPPMLTHAFKGAEYGNDVRSHIGFNVYTAAPDSSKVVGNAWIKGRGIYAKFHEDSPDGGVASIRRILDEAKHELEGNSL